MCFKAMSQRYPMFVTLHPQTMASKTDLRKAPKEEEDMLKSVLSSVSRCQALNTLMCSGSLEA